MSLEKIKRFLSDRIGLNSDTLGENTVQQVVKHRMAQLNKTDFSAYFEYIQEKDEELNNLITEVTVPETWFFRDTGPFELLRNYLVPKIFKNPEKGKLNILSIPCASGEEPYSIAIYLMESGLSGNDFHITAVDINSNYLEVARKGIYGKNSFREKQIDWQEKYFTFKNEKYSICNELKRKVKFITGNILTLEKIGLYKTFNLIFCRNLLIYFTEEARRKSVRILKKLLDDNGILITGHAETGIFRNAGFIPLKIRKGFAFTNQPNSKQKVDKIPQTTPKNPTATISKIETTRTNEPIQKITTEKTVSNPSVDYDIILKEIEKNADKGNYEKAEILCKKYLENIKNDFRGYFFMGLIKSALNDEKGAEENFNKSLYLRPDHYDTLIHLAFLKEHQGARNEAELLKKRALRITP